MNAFPPQELEFDGVKYVIPSNMVMGAIGCIERIITLHEMQQMIARRGTVELVPVSRAWGAVLRYAGAKVTDEEVYLKMFGDGPQAGAGVQLAVLGLLSMMMPPEAFSRAASQLKTAPPGNPSRQARRAEARLSKKPSRRHAGRKTSAAGD